MKNFKIYFPYILIVFLFLISFYSGSLFYLNNLDNKSGFLKVVFLDVKQGDAIYIEAPNGRQMLIDGGPDGSVLQRLSEVMPFGDFSIDVILQTHPDLDHIAGLSLVLDRYKVSKIIDNGASSTSETSQNLNQKISKKKITKITAQRGMRIILDQKRNVYFDILFPNKDISEMESNDASIVGRLVYGQNSFMLTGDATILTENLIIWDQGSQNLKSQVLKLGHHGSKTSSSFLWLEAVSPEVTVVSAGKNNSYGHPHQEVLDRLSFLKIPFLATYESGNLIFKADGQVLSY